MAKSQKTLEELFGKPAKQFLTVKEVKDILEIAEFLPEDAVAPAGGNIALSGFAPLAATIKSLKTQFVMKLKENGIPQEKADAAGEDFMRSVVSSYGSIMKNLKAGNY